MFVQIVFRPGTTCQNLDSDISVIGLLGFLKMKFANYAVCHICIFCFLRISDEIDKNVWCQWSVLKSISPQAIGFFCNCHSIDLLPPIPQSNCFQQNGHVSPLSAQVITRTFWNSAASKWFSAIWLLPSTEKWKMAKGGSVCFFWKDLGCVNGGLAGTGSVLFWVGDW